MIKSQTTFKLLVSTSRPLLASQLLLCSSSAAFHTGRVLGSQKEVHETWSKSLAETKLADDDSSLSAKINDSRFVVTWEHPMATQTQLHQIGVSHHQPKTLSDRIANTTLQFIRKSFDIFTGYHHPPKGKEDDPRYQMSERKWLERFVFLESIAGVPGMVGGMVRHLHSLRLMRRDKAWIETLLEEAYNERMHLLIFMKLSKPGIFMRFMLLGAQGVFFNLFFVSYLLFPRVCHRFVGYLEEEAIVTYTRCIEDIEAGRLSNWKTRKAPQIAIDYYHLPEDNQTMLDLVYYVRADEAKHREVNHTFGNLDQKHDRNPYALKIVDDKNTPQPSNDLSAPKPNGWERHEIAA
ncbi:hypothetical protein D0Z03_002085 [Geotrichum reessii]|nr:hypothetical protein D0Z03_002085 [Galactomyces reessii]